MSAKLDKEQRVDLDMMKNNVDLALLELDTIQSYKHNPTVYVELVGNALYTPYMLNYAPLEKRFEHIIKRLERDPGAVRAGQGQPGGRAGSLESRGAARRTTGTSS